MNANHEQIEAEIASARGKRLRIDVTIHQAIGIYACINASEMLLSPQSAETKAALKSLTENFRSELEKCVPLALQEFLESSEQVQKQCAQCDRNLVAEFLLARLPLDKVSALDIAGEIVRRLGRGAS